MVLVILVPWPWKSVRDGGFLRQESETFLHWQPLHCFFFQHILKYRIVEQRNVKRKIFILCSRQYGAVLAFYPLGALSVSAKLLSSIVAEKHQLQSFPDFLNLTRRLVLIGRTATPRIMWFFGHNAMWHSDSKKGRFKPQNGGNREFIVNPFFPKCVQRIFVWLAPGFFRFEKETFKVTKRWKWLAHC